MNLIEPAFRPAFNIIASVRREEPRYSAKIISSVMKKKLHGPGRVGRGGQEENTRGRARAVQALRQDSCEFQPVGYEVIGMSAASRLRRS